MRRISWLWRGHDHPTPYAEEVLCSLILYLHSMLTRDPSMISFPFSFLMFFEPGWRLRARMYKPSTGIDHKPSRSGPYSGGWSFFLECLFSLFDSIFLKHFFCLWCKFESIFLVWPSILWTHVPQLTFRSSRCAALAPQFALHSSPTEGLEIFSHFFDLINWSNIFWLGQEWG